jgi:hypothetical protein
LGIDVRDAIAAGDDLRRRLNHGHRELLSEMARTSDDGELAKLFPAWTAGGVD